jgi:ribose transport system substrate-binding protein
MKQATSSLLAMALVFAVGIFSSCQKPFHEETERYVLVAPSTSLPYWQEAKAGFMDATRGLGVKAEFTGSDSYSPQAELEAFQKAVASHPSGIAVSPARPDIFKDAIDAAVQSGIPVICIDSDAPESHRLLFMGTDNYQAGLMSGKRMADLLHGKGQVVIVTVPGQLNLDERVRGVADAFRKYPEIKILRTLDDKNDPRSANDQISSLLDAKSTVDGIVCVEAAGGPGAAESLHRLNLGGKIPIVAMDKTPETLDFISEGVISATVAQKPYTMAFYGLRFLDDLHHNIVHEFNDWHTAPVSPLPTRVDTGTAIIDASNLAAFRAAEAARRQPL